MIHAICNIQTHVQSIVLQIGTLRCQQKELKQLQRRTKVTPYCLLCGYCGWRKGMSQEEAMLSSEEIKPVALSIVELCLAEGIIQLVSQLVS